MNFFCCGEKARGSFNSNMSSRKRLSQYSGSTSNEYSHYQPISEASMIGEQPQWRQPIPEEKNESLANDIDYTKSKLLQFQEQLHNNSILKSSVKNNEKLSKSKIGRRSEIIEKNSKTINLKKSSISNEEFLMQQDQQFDSTQSKDQQISRENSKNDKTKEKRRE